MLTGKYRRIRWLPAFTFMGLVAALCLLTLQCTVEKEAANNHEPKGGASMTLALTSSAFSHNESIPAIHTCDGRDISPQLSWTSLPAGTKSLALIVDDPDAPDPRAPKMTWVHWVL